MKGLLLKDFYMLLSKNLRIFLLMLAVFLGISFVDYGDIFFVIYPVLITGILPSNLQSYDEQSKWTSYSAALPCSRAQIVSAKYLICLLMELAILLLAILVRSVQMLVRGVFAPMELLTLAAGILALALTIPAVTMPFLFKFGVEKGRLLFILSIALLTGISTFASIHIMDNGLTVPSGHLLALVLLAAIALYIGSWLLSIAFYQKKDL